MCQQFRTVKVTSYFKFTKFSFIDLSLLTEKVSQVNGQNRPVANPPVVDFHSQPKEMLIPKPLNT